MIEESVGIICACLPMCRMVLAWILPSVFGSTTSGTNDKAGSPYNGSHERAPSENSNSGWKPYVGPSKAGVSHSAVHHSDDASEEYILYPMRGGQADVEGAIRKTTKYEISYEHEHDPDVDKSELRQS